MRALLILAFIIAAGAVEAIEEVPSAMRRWTTAISATIQSRMNPAAAVGTGGGTVVVRFTVLRSGSVTSAELVRSSGISQIDNSALSAVRGSLPAAPNEVTQPSLSVTMPLAYRARPGISGTAPERGMGRVEPLTAAPSTSLKPPMPAECKWSKASRTDQTIRCPQDVAPVTSAENNVLLPIPDFEVVRLCRSASNDDTSVRYCVKSEQQAYDHLKIIWSDLSEKDKVYASRYAGNGVYAYTHIAEMADILLRQARDQKEKQEPIEFHR